jgi:hypothetical protein
MAREFNIKYAGSIDSNANWVTSLKSFTRFLYKIVRGIGEVIEELRKAKRNRVYRVESEVCRGYRGHYIRRTTTLTPWHRPIREN